MSNLFLGTHSPRLDEKGRLILPAKFRERLAGGVVVTRGQEGCLYIFPMGEFERVVSGLQTTPTSTPAERAFERLFLSGAFDEVPDRQGRVTVPATLRQYARLERDCTLTGAGSRLELWATPVWETYLAATEDRLAHQAEEVVPGVL